MKLICTVLNVSLLLYFVEGSLNFTSTKTFLDKDESKTDLITNRFYSIWDQYLRKITKNGEPLLLVYCCDMPRHMQHCFCCASACNLETPLLPTVLPRSCCHLPPPYIRCDCCPQACSQLDRPEQSNKYKETTHSTINCCYLPKEEQNCDCCPEACNDLAVARRRESLGSKYDCCFLPKNERHCSCCPNDCKKSTKEMGRTFKFSCCNLPKEVQECECCTSACTSPPDLGTVLSSCCHLPKYLRNCNCCPKDCIETTTELAVATTKKTPTTEITRDCCHAPEEQQKCSCCPSFCVENQKENCCNWPKTLQKCSCCPYACNDDYVVATRLDCDSSNGQKSNCKTSLGERIDSKEKKQYPSNDCCHLPPSVQNCSCCSTAPSCVPDIPEGLTCCHLPIVLQNCDCCPTKCKAGRFHQRVHLETAKNDDQGLLPKDSKTLIKSPSHQRSDTYHVAFTKPKPLSRSYNPISLVPLRSAFFQTYATKDPRNSYKQQYSNINYIPSSYLYDVVKSYKFDNHPRFVVRSEIPNSDTNYLEEYRNYLFQFTDRLLQRILQDIDDSELTQNIQGNKFTRTEANKHHMGLAALLKGVKDGLSKQVELKDLKDVVGRFARNITQSEKMALNQIFSVLKNEPEMRIGNTDDCDGCCELFTLIFNQLLEKPKVSGGMTNQLDSYVQGVDVGNFNNEIYGPMSGYFFYFHPINAGIVRNNKPTFNDFADESFLNQPNRWSSNNYQRLKQIDAQTYDYPNFEDYTDYRYDDNSSQKDKLHSRRIHKLNKLRRTPKRRLNFLLSKFNLRSKHVNRLDAKGKNHYGFANNNNDRNSNVMSYNAPNFRDAGSREEPTRWPIIDGSRNRKTIDYKGSNFVFNAGKSTNEEAYSEDETVPALISVIPTTITFLPLSETDLSKSNTFIDFYKDVRHSSKDSSLNEYENYDVSEYLPLNDNPEYKQQSNLPAMCKEHLNKGNNEKEEHNQLYEKDRLKLAPEKEFVPINDDVFEYDYSDFLGPFDISKYRKPRNTQAKLATLKSEKFSTTKATLEKNTMQERIMLNTTQISERNLNIMDLLTTTSNLDLSTAKSTEINFSNSSTEVEAENTTVTTDWKTLSQ